MQITNSEKITVSIIVPIYNMQRFLCECMDSLIEQTLVNMEFICVDDGSTDRSAEIVQMYVEKDQRVKLLKKMNGGYGSAVNTGIRAAKGKYIGIVEPDDYVCTDMFHQLWNIANKYDLDFVKADYSFFSGNGTERKFQRVMISPKLRWYNRRLKPCNMPELLEVDMMNVTGIYRRSFILKNDILLNETPGAAFQDTGLWFQIFTQAETCMFIPKSLYRIRRDNPNSSVLDSRKMVSVCDEYDTIYTWLQQDPDKVKVFGSSLFRRRVNAYLFALSICREDDKAIIYSRLFSSIKEAKENNEYDKNLFSRPMQLFIIQAEQHSTGMPYPVYKKSKFTLKKIFDCVKEHGLPFLIDNVLFKLGLKVKIY